MHNSADTDGTHPLDRIATALERIADLFEKFSRPTVLVDKNLFGVADQCIPKDHKPGKYDVIA